MALVWIPDPNEVRITDRVCIRVISKNNTGGFVERGTISTVVGRTPEGRKYWYPLDEPWKEKKYPKFSLWLKKHYPLTYKDGRTVRDIIGYKKDEKKKPISKP